MLYQIKRFVNLNARKFRRQFNKREPEIILTTGIILTALISFGIGRLSAPLANNEPIVIETPLTASIQKSFGAANQREKQKTAEGKFMGSVNGNKYHWPNCPHAKRISSENQVWFSSEKEAQAAGYKPCNNFGKYAPK
ncbi:MAG: Ada metal-binding domain-containing protein [Patescibacteria group bacterium]|nr:Ada metal-binding domain-containing protein [Patescibacteria group bacterium]